MERKYLRAQVIAINTRYTPVIMALVNYIHVLLLLCGWRGLIAENVAGVGVIPAVYILLNEWAYGFCWLHKSLVGYSVLVFGCINAQRWIGFGELLLPLQLAVFALGSWLFGVLITNWKVYGRQTRLRCS